MKDMKKRIIATILVIVMTVLTLASCASSAFSFAEEDLSAYATFDLAKFQEALKNIELEKDGDYTTDPETNEKKIWEDIYSSIANGVITDAKTYTDDKLESGAIGEKDIVYYTYYAKDADGNYYFRSHMNETNVTSTASSTLAKHRVMLGAIDTDNEFQVKVAELLAGKTPAKYYSMQNSTAVKEATGSLQVKPADMIVVSYDREHTKDDTKVKFTTDYQVVNLADTTDPFAAEIVKLINEKKEDTGRTVVVNYGAKITVTDSAGKATTTFDVTMGDTTYTYSNFNIDYKVDNYVSEDEAFSFTWIDDSLVDVEPDNLHTPGKKTEKLKEKELTYYIFPVYHLAVPEIDTASIIQYVYGKNIKDTSNELFSEDYSYTEEGKDAVKIKDMITELQNLWNEKFEKDSDLANLLKAKEDADKAVDEASNDKLDEAEKALEEATKKLNVAKRDAIKAYIAKMVAAKNGDKVLGTELYSEYEKDTRHELKEAYDTEITEAIGTAIWELIDEHVKLTGEYPQTLVDEFYKHLYESYEHSFYNDKHEIAGNTNSAINPSEYSHHNRDFNAFLLEHTGAAKNHNGDITAAITAEAKEHIAPLIKLYTVAKAYASADLGGKSINEIFKGYVQADIDSGAYDANYVNDDNLSDEENAKKKQEAEDAAKESKDKALKDAESFLVTNAVFDEFKKELGNKTYEAWLETYGEINIRAGLQFNKLFYYLTSTNLEMNDEDEENKHTEVKYVDKDGVLMLDFRTVGYSFKAEDSADDAE